MSLKLICPALLAAASTFVAFGQTAKNSTRPTDWPGQIPEQVMHGRAVRGELTFDDRANNIPGVVKIRVGVDEYGDVSTMKVLSGDKALVKDARTFLVRCKFPQALDQNQDAVSRELHGEQTDYSEPYNPGHLRFRTYEVIFSTPETKSKP
jgi:hypothetical protein